MDIINLTTTAKDIAIEAAHRTLGAGGLLIYPTETCYGLGADCENEEAVRTLLDFKMKREGKPFSIAVSDSTMAEKYVFANQVARNLYREFLPGPLTVISKSKGKVAPAVESEYRTVGIRIPDYTFVTELIKKYGKGITATSANVSYAKKPYSLAEWKRYTPKKNQNMVGLFLDAGKLPVRPASTVVDTTLEDFKILRQGDLQLENKNSVTVTTHSSEETQNVALDLIKHHITENPGKAIIYFLQGELGVGKTQFAKGIASALGIPHNILSPTFVIVREYPYSVEKTNVIFYHLDTWRLTSSDEVAELGIQEMIKPGNIIAIEWAEKVGNFFAAIKERPDVKIVWVKLRHVSESEREIKIFG